MAKMCQNCGTIINDDTASNCINCGAVLVGNGGAQQQAQYQTPQQPQYQQQFQQPMTPAQGKSKIGAGLLAIFLGPLGIHNFYLGYTGKGVAQLLITLLTCGIGAIVTWIWSLIEGIMIFTGSISTDANGMPLVD